VPRRTHVQDAVVVGAGDVQRLHRLRDAGVVHQHVDAAEGLQHGGDGGFARGLVGHVRDQADVAASQARGGGLGLGAREVEDRDPRALLRHEAGGREAEPVGAGAAGDDGDLVFQKHRESPGGLAWGEWSAPPKLKTSDMSSR
jgi:hypothetical protein